MAKITITVTDDPLDGSVGFVTDPPMETILEQKRKFGFKSLTPAQVYATIALSYMLEHAGSQVPKEKRGGVIIIPKGWDS